MIVISHTLSIPDDEVTLTAIRAQGAGGQHVNKTSTAIHLRFDIAASSLPESVKARLLTASHHLITAEERRLTSKAQKSTTKALRAKIRRSPD